MRVLTRESIICEYKTSNVFEAKKRPEVEARHERNGRGCYIVETKHSVPGFGQLCFDATERFHHLGRYINHVPKGPNARLTRPFEVRGKVRIGFLALRDIPEGEDLCYDYGDQSGGDWMRQGRLVEGRVVAGDTVEEAVEALAVPQTNPKKKKPHRNMYYCPLPQCAERECMEKIANHVHQFHDLHGLEGRRVLNQKIRATKAQEKERLKRKRPETGSEDIRAMLARPSRAGKESEATGVVGRVRGRGKRRGRGRGKRRGRGSGMKRGRERKRGKKRVGGRGSETECKRLWKRGREVMTQPPATLPCPINPGQGTWVGIRGHFLMGLTHF